MMAPDAPEPLGAWSAPADEGGLDSAPALGSGSQPARAPLRWPASRRRDPPASSPAPPVSDDDSDESESAESSEGDNCQGQERRVRVESSVIGQNGSSSGAAASAPQRPSAEHAEASDEGGAPVAALAEAMMKERVSAMFAITAPGPAASGMAKIADKMTYGLVDLAFIAIGKHCDQHRKALSRAYGNFDRVVGHGWLVLDALGFPFVDR